MSEYPSDWKVANLGEVVAEIVAGQSPNRMQHAARNGKKGILKTTAIQWSGFFPLENLEALPDFTANSNTIVRKNDILITKAGPSHRVGVVALSNEDTRTLHVSGKMAAIRTTEEMDPRFLAYQMSQDAFQMQLRSDITGMALSQTNITHDNLLTKRVVVPPRPEQKKIAEILSSLSSSAAALEHKSNRALRLFDEILSDHLRRCEVYPELTIEECIERFRVIQCYDKRTAAEPSGTPVIDQSTSGFFGFHHASPCFTASKRHPIMTFANHTCAIRLHTHPFSVIQNVFPIQGKEGIILTEYLHAIAPRLVTQSGYRGHYPEFRTTRIGVPPIDEQRQLLLKAQSAKQVADKALIAAEKIYLLKNAIASDLLSGRKRVSV